MTTQIGTSGWHVRHWRPGFYPGDLEPCAGREALDHWARRLAGTEEAYVYCNTDQVAPASRTTVDA